jgi:hypothetical protein
VIEKAFSQIVKVGGRRVGPRAAAWAEAVLLLDVHRSGVAELRAEVPPDHDPDWWSALHANPEVGWTYALTECGRLQRRDLLAPRCWMSTEALRSRVDALVAGVPAPGRAPERRRLVRLWDISQSPPDPISAAAAIAFLLRRNALGLDGCRHRLEGCKLESVWHSTLVGQRLESRLERNREEAAVVRALRQQADAARAVLHQLGLSFA